MTTMADLIAEYERLNWAMPKHHEQGRRMGDIAGILDRTGPVRIGRTLHHAGLAGDGSPMIFDIDLDAVREAADVPVPGTD